MCNKIVKYSYISEGVFNSLEPEDCDVQQTSEAVLTGLSIMTSLDHRTIMLMGKVWHILLSSKLEHLSHPRGQSTEAKTFSMHSNDSSR